MKAPQPRLTGLALAALALFSLQACGSANGAEDAVADDARARSAAPSAASAAQAGPGRGMAWVILGSDTVRAEVASTPEERRQGLMYREELDDGAGMLFVFGDEDVRSFWMSNTFIPLDIAFLDSGSRVVDIQQMEPEDTDLTESRAAAMYALEVPQGWFERRGIQVGAQASILFGPR